MSSSHLRHRLAGTGDERALVDRAQPPRVRGLGGMVVMAAPATSNIQPGVERHPSEPKGCLNNNYLTFRVHLSRCGCGGAAGVSTS